MKVYSLLLADLARLDEIDLGLHQFAFRKGHQSMEVTFALRQMTEKACEFQKPVYICAGDLFKAYDVTEHGPWMRALRAAGVPKIVASAWLREIRRAKCSVKLPGMEPSRAFHRMRSLLQGDPSAPKLFNIVLDQIIVRPFLVKARRMYWGAELDHDDLEELRTQG
eukprot:11158355-Lingulodinium_polyedra.AAC.1